MAELKDDNNQGQQNQQQTGQQGNNPNADPNYKPATTGAVIDPENDGRLKENREEMRTKGTTEHSKQAPNVDQDNSGSVNAEDRERMAARRARDDDGYDNNQRDQD